MNKYEVAFIIKPNTNEEAIKEIISKLKEIYINHNGTILDEFDMGTREMAYEIEKSKIGYYYFLNVEADHAANQEFERICRINEDVIRFLVINIDDVEGSTLDILREKTR